MDLPEAQVSPRHARESKSGSPEIFLLVELAQDGLDIVIEEFGMESGIKDCPGFPYMRRQGDAFTPDAARLEFIDDFINLGLVALLAMKMALGEILIRLGWERS